MRRIIGIAKWGLTLGREPQNFLGAKWVTKFLERSRESKKRIWALRLLSLSPHYFINPDAPEYKGMSSDQYLETVFQVIANSRLKIYDQILKEHLQPDDVVLDYGCGPGFLARAVAPHVAKIYACDISTGALACARVLNAQPNLEYIVADEQGLTRIHDESLDAVFSFAMVQHLSDETYETVLENCWRKLKPGGRLIFHVQMLDSTWRSEEDWKNDSSVAGKIKFRYGLHCFGRSEERHREMVAKHGFADIRLKSLTDLVTENVEELGSQAMLSAVKAP